ncbi:hypothetical protein DPMN_071409 [Dreissena polymorpha]|uniref:Uncharacterized protein n=1 Tax=Dreissena polymorpha TaxID=45954 RepID=A0A9D4BPM1_DREPO|nr:hypothetical protein DPMN_071409 [Dreissena polymorpha]
MLRRHAYHVIPRLPSTIGNGIAELTDVRAAFLEVVSPHMYCVSSFINSLAGYYIKNSDERQTFRTIESFTAFVAESARPVVSIADTQSCLNN